MLGQAEKGDALKQVEALQSAARSSESTAKLELAELKLSLEKKQQQLVEHQSTCSSHEVGGIGGTYTAFLLLARAAVCMSFLCCFASTIGSLMAVVALVGHTQRQFRSGNSSSC